MSEPLLLQPVMHEKLWGGTALRDRFGYDIPSDQTGEAWVISGHKNGVEKVKQGRFTGRTVADLWQNEPALFENQHPDQPFPLLVKLLDANLDLSVQVHPDNPYAAAHHGELGKTESWYVVDAKPGAIIYYGHNAKTKEEFDQAVDNAEWDQLLTKVPVKPGDFFYVPAGTLHALGAGTLILETQQSSDVTYRVYDFDRRDAKTGELRELHLADAKNVTSVPFVPYETNRTVEEKDAATLTTLVQAPYFNVVKVELNGPATFTKQAPYTLGTVIKGDVTLTVDGQDYALPFGQPFILPADVQSWQLSGDATLITSVPGPALLG